MSANYQYWIYGSGCWNFLRLNLNTIFVNPIWNLRHSWSWKNLEGNKHFRIAWLSCSARGPKLRFFSGHQCTSQSQFPRFTFSAAYLHRWGCSCSSWFYLLACVNMDFTRSQAHVWRRNRGCRNSWDQIHFDDTAGAARRKYHLWKDKKTFCGWLISIKSWDVLGHARRWAQ